MNALQQLHNQANDALVRRLHSELCGLRCGVGHISQAAEGLATRPLVPSDTAGIVDAGRDSGGDSGTQELLEGWDDCLGTQGVRGAV